MSGRVGPFRLLKDVSAGLPGVAWLAQGDDGAQVMLKRARQQAPTNEFRLLAELDHPGVPRLAGCGLDGGEFWVATHWLDGTTLEGGFAAGADEDEFAAATAHALLYLASCGVVHGDVHPGNLLVARAGYAARLLDFGLASDAPNLPAGRRGFIAPEVIAGGERTTASDLFGLGASVRARGAARSGNVERLAEALISPDPGVRVAAAREFVSKRARPACGPRKNYRATDLARVTELLDGGMENSRALLIVGEPGMGKSSLLERVFLEASARGWNVEREARGSADELAMRWGRGLRPLLVVIDDLDRRGNAESVSRAVDGVARAGVSRVLVVATSAGELAGWRHERMDLARVGVAEITAIFRQVSGVEALSDDDVRRVADLAGGSPRHAVAVARAAVSGGAMEFRLGAWSLRPQAPIPVPVEAAAAARPLVAALEPRAIRLLAAASLAAGVISRASLPVAADAGTAELELLEASGLVHADGAGVVPVDAAVGNAATERLTQEERRSLHRRLGALTEEAGAPRWVSAWHWIRSGDPAPAIAASLAAAVELQDTGDLQGARMILAAALELAVGSEAERSRVAAALVLVDSEERAHEEIARRAEALVGGELELSMRRLMAAVAITQWHRLRRWEDRDAAVARMTPALGDWVQQRVAFSRMISNVGRGLKVDSTANPLRLDQCRLASEARFLGWSAAMRGEFRAAARAELRAANLARREKSWRTFGAALDAAVVSLILCGGRSRAQRVLDQGHAISIRAGRAGSMPTIFSARVALAMAAGEVGRGLACIREYETLVDLLSLPADVRRRSRPAKANLLRFAGKPLAAMEVFASAPVAGVDCFRAWDSLPRVLSLLDLGRWDDAANAAAEGIRLFRELGDTSGAAALLAFSALSQREAGRAREWKAAVGELPLVIAGDPHAQATCDWMRLEVLLEDPGPADTAGLVASIAQVAHFQRLFGGEAAARAALACASAGHAGSARLLLDAISPVPDSPLIEVWAAVARARLEKFSVAARRHLDSVKALLPEAGASAWRAWLSVSDSLSLGVTGQGGTDQEKKKPDGHLVPNGNEVETEDIVAPRSLASQARHIRDIVREINAERDVARLLDKVLDSAIAISGAERGCLVLVDGNRFEVRAARPTDSGLGSADVFSRTVSDKVIISGDAFCSGDAVGDERLRESVSIPRLNVHSVVCMPFRLQGQTLGSLYLDHRRRADAFDPGAIDALQTLADLAAVAIENAQLFEEAGRQKNALAERAKRLERRLEEVERGAKGDLESGLKYRYSEIVGRGAAMMKMLRSLDRATDQVLPVLIQGETGAGKELVASALHANGPHHRGPFVKENCAAISPLLMESELFGHVKGAFSGASADHEGLFRRADGGVLLLDEIGDLEMGLQAKLLRVLEDGVVRPVGSDRSYRVKVRVVAATHRDLEELVSKGRFRRDLYYRLASFRVAVPSLKERREDIPELVRRFLGKIGKFEVETQAMKLLVSCEWPGNVRQLEHLASVLASGGEAEIGMEQVREVLGRDLATAPVAEDSLNDALNKLRMARVQAAIVACDGKLTQAAKQLGMTYQGIRKIAAKYKLLGLKDLAKPVNRSSKSGKSRSGRR